MKSTRRRLSLEQLEPRLMLAGDITLVQSYQLWDGGTIRSTDAAGLTFHLPSGHLFLADSEINETPYFSPEGHNIFEFSTDGQNLHQEIASNNDEPTGITYNEADGYFYVTNDNGSGRGIYRYDATFSSPLAIIDPTNDVSNALDLEGISSNPVTGDLYVIDGADGGVQVLVYDKFLTFQYSFSVAGEMNDGEGIAYHAGSNHLFIVSDPASKIFEYTLTGTFVEEYSIGGFSPDPKAPQGLTFAPTSDPNDDPSLLAIYIADGGQDEVADGRIYEAIIQGLSPAVNEPPVANAGGDQTVGANWAGVAQLALDGTAFDDLLPSPGALTTLWSQVSGPDTVTFGDDTAIDTTATFVSSGTYVIRLTADDGQLSVYDEATITVTAAGTQVISVDSRVDMSSDDAEEQPSGSIKLSSSDLEMVDDDADNQIIGIRFNNITVPHDAILVGAYIQFQVDAKTVDPASLLIEGQAIADAPTFANFSNNVSLRTRTNNSVLWAPPAWNNKGDAGPDQQTPDLVSIIQEIINQPGWLSGNSVAMVITGSGLREAVAFDGVPNGAPLLHIEYQLPPPTNNPPVVDDQLFAVDENSASSTVVGTVVASDPDAGQTLSYMITAGNTGGAFAIDSSGQITVANSAALDFETTPSFALTVEVTDNGVSPLSDTATITVNLNDVNDSPIVDDQVFAVDENSAVSTVVGTVVASDPDAGQTLSYMITAGNTGGAFAIDSSGQITVANSAALDFETTPSFALTVEVTDNGTSPLSDTATITVNLNDVNDSPIVDDQVFAVDENSAISTVVGTVVASDPDAGQTLSYMITAGNTGGAFAIDSSGQITVANSAALDFETTPSFALTVEVTDNGTSPLADTATITVNMNDVNDFPVVDDQVFAVDENSAISTVVGTVVASDQDAGQTLSYMITAGNTGGAFAIDSSGQITVANGGALDFETTPSFALTVEVTDNGASPLSDTATITVNLNDLNESPTVDDQLFALDENSASSTVVGTVVASDPDAGQTLSYMITAGNTGGAFAIDSSGQITVANGGALDFETTPSFALTVEVTDNGASPLSDTATVTVNLNDVNESPTVDDQLFSLDENSANSTVVGTVVASDPDAGQTLSYMITAGNTGGAFAIDSSGQITVANSAALDFETTPSFALTVEVTDNGASPLSDTATITVNLNDVNESPTTGTIERRISASSDDAEEKGSGTVKLTSVDLDLVFENGNQTVGLRFTDIGVPQGAQITNAYVQFEADGADSGATSLVIRGQAVDDAATFAAVNGNVSSRAKTSSQVLWTPPTWVANRDAGPDQQTPNIAAVIEEIVNRTGWTSGNSLALIITGSGYRVAESFDGDASSAPLLHIEYTEAGGNAAPSVVAGDDQTVESDESGTAQVTLDGTVFDDGLPDPPAAFTTMWSKLSGPGNVTFGDDTAIDTTATMTVPGTYVLRLTADDGELQSSDDVTIEVTEAGATFTLERSISASSDDAEEKGSGTIKLTSVDLDLVFENGNQTVGLRFADIGVPQGAQITNAYVQFEADGADSGATSLEIRGQDIDNAPTFTAVNGNISSRVKTSSQVTWAPPAWVANRDAGPDQQTANIAAVIQEIVNRAGWTSGNSLALIITGSGYRVAESFDGDASSAPRLHIEYTIPSPLMADASQSLPQGDAANLTQTQADAMTAAARSLWETASAASSVPVVQVIVDDLPAGMLGFASNGVITLDINGDGRGWFIDSSPLENSEFAVASAGYSFVATSESDAEGHYDLLTVAAHEIGHLLGYNHTGDGGLMSDTLSTGTRSLPSTLIADEVSSNASKSVSVVTPADSPATSVLAFSDLPANLPAEFFDNALRAEGNANNRRRNSEDVSARHLPPGSNAIDFGQLTRTSSRGDVKDYADWFEDALDEILANDVLDEDLLSQLAKNLVGPFERD